MNNFIDIETNVDTDKTIDNQYQMATAFEEKEKEKEPIRHLIISGGGPSGIQTLGALQYLEEHGVWKIENIESIYSVSVGGLLSVLMALRFDWPTINDYILKRPWHEAVQLEVSQVFDMFSKKGLYDVSIAKIFFKPFFDVRDISLEITLKDFYEVTKIELHFITTDLNSFEIEDLCYISHPELKLIECVYMSATIPILFSPICMNGKCYLDGGMIMNYPLPYCVKAIGKEKEAQILGFKNVYTKKPFGSISKESTILEFATAIISKLVGRTQGSTEAGQSISNEVLCETFQMSFFYLHEGIHSREKREELLKLGRLSGENFYNCVWLSSCNT